MVKLQGTAPNQVPTNADLGSLAYADHDNVNLTAADLKLKALSKTKSQTAVDVFVYDTSKDTDGGAWRHRTQHTSWYNEGASSTRGSRAEFPSVAVIVAESDTVTIYDGDDPSLPMWMVFNQAAGGFIYTSTVTSVAALNSQIEIGMATGGGRSTINFAADYGFYQQATAVEFNRKPVSAENYSTVTATGTVGAIVNRVVNDVAMTVLPNAPTDPATGLPVPTIAVATDGGVSVIKDDGTVVDVTGTASFSSVGFSGSNRIVAYQVSTKDVQTYSVPTADASFSTGGVFSGGVSDGNYYREGFVPPIMANGSYVAGQTDLKPTYAEDKIAFSWREATGSEGVGFLLEDVATPANGMVSKTTSDYATGWMNGNIKLAALADTTAETLSGTPLLDDDFGTYADTAAMKSAGWSSTSSIGTGDISLVSGAMQLDSNGTSNRARGSRSFTTVSGKTYVVEYSATGQATSNHHFRVGTAENGNQNLEVFNRPAGSLVSTFVATDTTTYVTWEGFTAVGNETQIDNISVRLADPDRSVNGNGLGVHGSITKAAVATGADVVAYSAFSTGNYLEQPYHSGIPDGTGQDIFITSWVHRPVLGAAVIADFGEVASGKRRLFYVVGTSGSLAANNGVAQVNPVTVPSDTWVQCGLIWYANDDLKFYINGQEVGTGTLSRTAQTQDNSLYVGGGRLGSNASTKLALLRISATAPTADQIAKIYEDEKFLFQENAKATLTGSSDAVTALAYDPDTNLLHVGTSGGRSVFQGLRQVEEHTGTDSQSLAAISAVDGLVVEGK